MEKKDTTTNALFEPRTQVIRTDEGIYSRFSQNLELIELYIRAYQNI